MDISPKQYAQSLFESLADKKNQNEIKTTIEIFANILESNNDLAKSRQVIIEFESLWNRKNGIVEAKITSAKKLDKELVKSISAYIAETTDASEVKISEKIEENLLGGAILEYENRIMDMSLRTGLKSLRRELEK